MASLIRAYDIYIYDIYINIFHFRVISLDFQNTQAKVCAIYTMEEKKWNFLLSIFGILNTITEYGDITICIYGLIRWRVCIFYMVASAAVVVDFPYAARCVCCCVRSDVVWRASF